MSHDVDLSTEIVTNCIAPITSFVFSKTMRCMDHTLSDLAFVQKLIGDILDVQENIHLLHAFILNHRFAMSQHLKECVNYIFFCFCLCQL